MAQDIVHASRLGRFMTADGLAYLEYHLVNSKSTPTMDIVHTYVPPSKRGGGIAAKLCIEAYNYARSEGLKVIPSCSYVQVSACEGSMVICRAPLDLFSSSSRKVFKFITLRVISCPAAV